MPLHVKDGRDSRWDSHREARRAELVEAAVAAIDEHGPTASIADIAVSAGVSKPVLYRYFSDKDDLYRAVGHWAPTRSCRRSCPRCSTSDHCASASSARAATTSP